MSSSKRSGLLVAMFFVPLLLGAAGGSPKLKGKAGRGKAVFQESGCWRCHNTGSPEPRVLRAGATPAPSLMGIFQRPPHQLADGTKHEKHTDEMLRTIITEGTRAMAARGAALSDKELDDLLAYLHTL